MVRGNGSGEQAPLTRSQLMLWTGQKLQPDDPLYNMALSFRIRGALDPAAFRAAFTALLANCDALRSTFVTVDGVPRQLFRDTATCDMEFIDLSNSDEPDAALERWQKDRSQTCFDLAAGVIDCALLKLGDEDFAWYLCQHHLAIDAWSASLVFRAMELHYRLALDGRLDEAQPLPEFHDYVDFEAARRDSRLTERADEYWREQLRRPTPPSSFYRPTPTDRSGRTERLRCELGRSRCARIRALTQSAPFRAMTPDLAGFQVFATVLFALLHRIGGNELLAIGTPTHNRGTSRHKKTVGLFIEMYPLRVEIGDGETFLSLYEKVAQRERELLINAPPGASGFEHNRAYDVVLNYITAKFGDFDGMATETTWIHPDHGDRNHLLRMQVEDFDDTDDFRVFFDVNVDTVVGEERDRLMRHILVLLDAMLDDPRTVVADVVLNDEAETRELARGLAPAEPRPKPVRTVVEAFAEQARRSPEVTAVVEGDTHTSYGELLARSEALAGRLAAGGVTRGARVAIALPRSTDAVVAMLATLRCGAAYVPVDIGYPAERIGLMLEDASVVRVVTRADLRFALPATAPFIDIGQAGATSDAAGLLPPMPSLEDAAYVIYTSGSTGMPKGVDVRHAGLANYVGWATDYYTGGQSLAWPLFSSLSFDLTVTSIFVPLVSGGRIVVYPERDDRREITIRRVVEDNAIDIMKVTPAHLSLLQAMDLSGSRLRSIIVGGEDFKVDLARSISNYFGGRIAIYNEYGPTEATVACMIHRFDPDADTGASVPIGTAIDNAFVYVLDDSLSLQPPGVVGELCIGGVGVAAGYLGRREQTCKRFVPNPFRPGETLYRSGDFARSNPDGTLTCLGRADRQCKINGIRVEPGEIEAALLAYPGVSECAVRLIEVSDSHDQPDLGCVRCGLSDRHPAAMLDDDQVCRICRAYETEREQARAYFRTHDDLERIVAEIRAESDGTPDCLMLLSGGKDSTYALCQLVDLGLTPLVFTLDNGYISDGARANIERVVGQLGLELVVGSTPAMNRIFVDSLNRFSNVCNGCFKTIYTLSMKIARERGLRHIFTGLSRGQIFETRVADLFRLGMFDTDTIDSMIVDARKAYHRADDAVSKLLDVSHFADDSIFEEVRFVDYYRYSDVSLDEMLSYLRERVPWVRPADTGRSTNCLINEVGIHVHKRERGYHNYALPYSWDVRLGHKEREAAVDELDDDINIDNVQRILSEIGYSPREHRPGATMRRFLAAYYVADEELDADVVRARLARRLPAELVPAHLVHVDCLPLTPNGKVDRDALPHPELSRPSIVADFVAPSGHLETTLAAIWGQVFGIDAVGVNDNFFDLGGDSIMNIQIVSLALKHGLRLSPQQVFERPTVAELARVIDTVGEVTSEQGPLTGEVALTPVQLRFFEAGLPHPDRYAQIALLESPAEIDLLALQEALRQLAAHHDALRSRFRQEAGGWTQSIAGPSEAVIEVHRVDLSNVAAHALDAEIMSRAAELQHQLDIERGPLVRAAVLVRGPGQPTLTLLVVHHLVVDAVSWWILVEDLDHAYRSIATGRPVTLPPKTTSVRRWAEAVVSFADTDRALQTLPLWQRDRESAIPVDAAGDNSLAGEGCQTVTLGAHETRTLTTDVVSMWRVQPQDVMIAALLRTFDGWVGTDHLAIDIEGHGRENLSDEIDLLRTVGWFTSVYPVTFELAPAEDSGELLRRVRDSVRAVPDGGIARGALRYLCSDDAVRAELAGQAAPKVLFNYLGQWRDQLTTGAAFRFARPIMASFGHDGPRRYLLELNAVVYEGRLRVEWSYNRDTYRRDTIARLTRNFRRNLQELIDHCSSSGDDRFAPEDFPTASLSQGELDEILAEFGEP